MLFRSNLMEPKEHMNEQELRAIENAVRSRIGAKTKELTDLRKRENITRITPNSEMSPQEKALEIKAIQEKRKDLLSDVQVLRDYVYRGE